MAFQAEAAAWLRTLTPTTPRLSPHLMSVGFPVCRMGILKAYLTLLFYTYDECAIKRPDGCLENTSVVLAN